jgi:HEAT repeat protein
MGGPDAVGTPSLSGGGDLGMDLNLWSFWWEFNKDPYLNLKAKVHEESNQTGSDGFFLGHGGREQSKDTLRPSPEQIRQSVVPALLAALERETNNDIVTGCLIALAKIGDAPSETGQSQFQPVLAHFLSDKNQEISETAAVALGILANPASIEPLADLLGDSRKGRELVGQPEVGYRTRSFAAYGLGLIGAAASAEEDRVRIVTILRQALEADDTRTRDLKVSCVIAMGLVPLETLESSAKPEKKDAMVPPESSRAAQLDYLLAFLDSEEENYLVRAHCPTALSRLLTGLPDSMRAQYRERIATDLIAHIGPKAKEPAELVQSAVLALGLLGTNDGGDPLDQRIRSALIAVQKNVSDVQARHFAMIALAKVGGASGGSDPEAGIDQVADALLEQLADGKASVKPWAGLACGVLAELLNRNPVQFSKVGALQIAVRTALEQQKSPADLGAYAIASGIMADRESKYILLRQLASAKDDEARGYVAVALGLMDAREAVVEINRIVDESKYRPELLRQAAIALGLLGDKDLVPKLVTLLQESKGLATQASLSSALGFIGDKNSIAPLVQMLQNQDITERARGFAAVALGIVADKEMLPWNSKIGLDLNYRAATQTLTNRSSGTGILDIL